jgi:hypothetical protein
MGAYAFANMVVGLFQPEFVAKRHDANFVASVTDHVFRMIEKDPQLLEAYNSMIGNPPQRKQNVNMAIGRQVKVLFGLKDRDDPKTERNPESALITTHTRLRV